MEAIPNLVLTPATERALRLASEVVEDLGLSFDEAVVLRDKSNLLVHFRPTDVVARIATGTVKVRHGNAWLSREVAVAGHLVAVGAPVVSPSRELSCGPHSRGGCVMTLREYVPELDEPTEPRRAGQALRECHEALDDFEGELPFLGLLEETDEIVSMLARGGMLSSADSAMLRRTSERSLRRLHGSGLPMKPAHGDANLTNCLNSPSGPIWTDWEDTFKGPREWDLACLVARSRVLGEGAPRAEAALAAYGGVADDDAFDWLVEARVLQIAAWLSLRTLSLSVDESRLGERLAWLRARDEVAG